MKKNFYLMALAAAITATPTMGQDVVEDNLDVVVEQTTATFDDIEIGESGYYNGSDLEGSFKSGAYQFEVNYNSTYGSWSGFAVSEKTETNFVNYKESQYNSCVGSGYNNSSNYVVAYPNTYGIEPGQSEKITASNGSAFDAKGFFITNSAWNVDSYLNGDGQTGTAGDGQAFTGTDPFRTGDWFKITAYGVHEDNSVATVDFYLADYRSENEEDHYYVSDWQWFDLTSLGTVKEVSFWTSSSRNNSWGMTTPGYFCMDNFNDGDFTPTAISSMKNSTKEAVVVARYTLDGRKIAAPQHGINIVKMSDGSTRKVMVK